MVLPVPVRPNTKTDSVVSPAQRGKEPLQHLAMPRPPDQGKRAAELGDVARLGDQAAEAA